MASCQNAAELDAEKVTDEGPRDLLGWHYIKERIRKSKLFLQLLHIFLNRKQELRSLLMPCER